MKKNNISFETKFWAGFEAGNPFEAVDAFFDYAHLDNYKQNLSGAVLHSYKKKIYKQDNPGQIFILYKVVRSFLKISYCLQTKNKKWKVKDAARSETVFHLSSLTKQEYDNPFLVFQKAFDEQTLKQFEFFLCEIVHLSLSSCLGDQDFDLLTPYIHLIKMLDALQLMKERGVERIKKTDHIKPVTE
jgi:hypothetical protein